MNKTRSSKKDRKKNFLKNQTELNSGAESRMTGVKSVMESINRRSDQKEGKKP